MITETLSLQLFIVGNWNQWICKRKREAESDGRIQREEEAILNEGNKKAIIVKEQKPEMLL